MYAGVAEHSVHVTADAIGRGIGRVPLEPLIAPTYTAGIRSPSGVFPEDAASLALHRRCGFRIGGRRDSLLP